MSIKHVRRLVHWAGLFFLASKLELQMGIFAYCPLCLPTAGRKSTVNKSQGKCVLKEKNIMEGFKNIDDEVSKLDGVYTKRVSKKVFAAFIIVGLCALYVSTRMTGAEATAVGMTGVGSTWIGIVGVMLFCISFGMIIMGLVGVAKPVEMIYCKQTKEMLVKQVFYFNAADKNIVRNAIREGDKVALKLIHNSQNNNMRAIVYATPSYKYGVPVEDPVICSTCLAN